MLQNEKVLVEKMTKQVSKGNRRFCLVSEASQKKNVILGSCLILRIQV